VGERVLDMGAGCGILGIIVAKKASGVVAIDINPYAVSCAKENAKLNNVRSKMTFIQGDLFMPLREKAKFDVVLFNAPYLPTEGSEAYSWVGHAWAGGTEGREIIDRFIPDAAKHLKPAGRILLMQSTLSCVDKTLLKFKECGLKASVIAEADLPFFETIILIKAT
jgi:release factor glutamine methyltransferase